MTGPSPQGRSGAAGRRVALLALALGLGLAGCSTVKEKLADVLPGSDPVYRSSKSLPPLEVPPDLSSSSINDTLAVPGAPGGEATYSDYQRRQQATGQVAGAAPVAQGVLPQLVNVTVERSGDKRWLRVKARPAVVWPRVRDFWLNQGFLIKTEDPGLGIMETDWEEKRADLDRGIMGKLMGTLSTAFYGAAERDKYRTRLERGGNEDETEIFISHRGAELLTHDINKKEGEAQRVWQPRPADPELEAEMLHRMMLFFGVEGQKARRMVAAAPRRQRARMEADDGGRLLWLEDEFSRAWRRTGLALDRVGFTVEDRDRSRGLYYVRYVDPDVAAARKEQEGFFSKLKFWESGDAPRGGDAYLISLVGGKGVTRVFVLDEKGKRATNSTSERILGLLEKELR